MHTVSYIKEAVDLQCAMHQSPLLTLCRILGQLDSGGITGAYTASPVYAGSWLGSQYDDEGRQPGGPETDEEDEDQPLGNLPEPKFTCIMAGYGGRINTCTVSFIDYTNTDVLVLNYTYMYGDSGGTHSSAIVCSKRRINEDTESQLFSLWTSLKTINQGRPRPIIQERQPTTVLMNVNYLYKDCTRQNSHWYVNTTVTCPISPPSINQNFKELFETTCVERTRSNITYGRMMQVVSDGTIRIIESRVLGPEPVQEPPESRVDDGNGDDVIR